MKLFKKRNNKGFSLVELIVVVAIMAVLLGVLVPTLIRHVESSKLGKDKQAIDNVKEAIEVALANEKYMAVEVPSVELYDGGKVNLDKLATATSTDFVTEVKANLGNKSTIALTSKLAASGTTIKVTIKDCVCTIAVDATKGGDYKFTIGETEAAGKPATPSEGATTTAESATP